MTTLTDFLLARITEDEAITARADGSVWRPPADHYPMGAFEGGHLVSMSAPRALVECAVKRRIVERCAPLYDIQVRRQTMTLAGDVLCALALAYAGHPDYREEWKP